MKKIFFLLTLGLLIIGISQNSFAGIKLIDCAITPGEHYPAIESLFVIESNKESDSDGNKLSFVSCHDREGSTYKVAISGIGIGLEIVAYEIFKLAYVGLASDISGTYYGIRAAACVVGGVNTGIAVGNWGELTTFGLDGLGAGFDLSLVRIYIGTSWQGVATTYKEDLANNPPTAQ